MLSNYYYRSFCYSYIIYSCITIYCNSSFCLFVCLLIQRSIFSMRVFCREHEFALTRGLCQFAGVYLVGAQLCVYDVQRRTSLTIYTASLREFGASFLRSVRMLTGVADSHRAVARTFARRHRRPCSKDRHGVDIIGLDSIAAEHRAGPTRCLRSPGSAYVIDAPYKAPRRPTCFA